MNTKSISAFFKKIETQMVKHSPEILTGIGITGMITAGVMAVRATPKALDLLSEIHEKVKYKAKQHRFLDAALPKRKE